MRKFRKIIALLVVMVMAFATMPQMVLSAGFDGNPEYTTEFEAYCQGWGNWSAAKFDKANTFFCVTNTVAHSGRNSVVIKHTDPSQNWKAVILSQEGLSYGAGNYTFSFWATGTYANNLCGMTTNGDHWDDFYITDFTVSETDGIWKKYTVDFTVPAGKTQNAVTLMSNGDTQGFYIDDISLVKSGTTNNLLKNAGFEEKEEDEPEAPVYTTEFKDYFYCWSDWSAVAHDGNKVFFCVTDKDSYSGNNSFVLRHVDGTKTSNICLAQNVPSLEAGNYTISFWATGAGNGKEGVTLADPWRMYNIGTFEIVATDGDWKKYEKTVTAYGGETAITFMTDGQTEGWYLDEVSLVKNGTTSNIIKNGSFEEKAEEGPDAPEVPDEVEVPVYTTEFEDYFASWEKEYGVTENGSTIFSCVTNEKAYSGNNSIALRHVDGSQHDKDLLIKQTGLNLGAGNYTFSFWATGTVADKDNDTYRYQQIVWLEGLDPSYRYVTDMTTGTKDGDWAYYTLDFVVPSGSTVSAVKVSSRGYGTEGLYIDDFNLVAQGASENLLKNASFEEDGVPNYTTEYADYFYGWNDWSAVEHDGNKVFMCVTDEDSHSGNNSFVLRHVDGTKTSNICLAQNVPSLEAGNYTISFWAVGTTNNGMQAATLADPWKKYPIEEFEITATDGAWKKYEKTVTVQGGETAITFPTDGSTNGWYIDDISLVKEGTTENIVRNGGFEERDPDVQAGDVVREVILKKNGQRTENLAGKGNYSVTLVIDNYAVDTVLNVEQFVAVYDEDGVLVKVYSTKASIDRAVTDGALTKIETKFTLPEGNYTVENFAFDGRDTLNIIGNPNPHRVFEQN